MNAMGRLSKQRQSNLDLSIRGDELEQDRIQLEHTLQHAELSFHLSSTPDTASQADGDRASIEYPRHATEPTAFREFASLEQRSRDYFDEDGDHIHPWSYRSADDEEGINPYGGETLSTAAHHASNLTLAAGLGRGYRNEISMSGAEYDPDRPLRDILPAVASRISAFSYEPSRSRYPGMGSVDADPLVIDNTAELDRILQSGHAAAPHRSVRPHSPHPPSESSASSDAESASGRPKLSEALRRVSFSPRRPRSVQSNYSQKDAHHANISPAHSTDSNLKHSPMREPDRSRVSSKHLLTSTKSSHRSSARVAPSSSAPHWQSQSVDYDAPTPKARRTGVFPSHATSQLDPLAGDSRPKSQRQTARVTTEEQGVQTRKTSQVSRANVHSRNPQIHIVNASPRPARATPRKIGLRETSHILNSSRISEQGKLYLPDVTGITNAVESPARPQAAYYKYENDGKPREVEVYFLTALNEVQAKLYRLEEENSISRRRVRELEMELEVCKREVARERTRVLEREEMIVQQKLEGERRQARDTKGKGREQDDLDTMERRYKEAVEEKKALEALITTLRSHLTRLTSELADHKQLLTELRNLREADTRRMQEKAGEIEHLKQEVERLAGEVEVLRGVVEEGLKERRESGRSRVPSEDEGEPFHESKHEVPIDEAPSRTDEQEPVEELVQSESESEGSNSSVIGDVEELESIIGSSRANPLDKTMRTDHATAGSSSLGPSTSATPFITSEALQQISAELEERRAERSRSLSSSASHDSLSQGEIHNSMVSGRHSQVHSAVRSHPPSPSPIGRGGSMLLTGDEESEAEVPVSPQRPTVSDHREARRGTPIPSARTVPSLSRPTAPTPAHASRQPNPGPSIEETPFPQIRGEHLERLFFSAPEHNAKTCTMCLREGRRMNNQHTYTRQGRPSSPLWSIRSRTKERKTTVANTLDEDEGFAEGEEDEPQRMPDIKRKARDPKVVPLDSDHRYRQGSPKDPLPPQTTLTLVIRELEDDFTHYKSIYVELADEYKDMDPVSNVRKRNMLAQHLHEIVDILEQKGDQIAKLYSLLTFKDTPITDSHKPRKHSTVHTGVVME